MSTTTVSYSSPTRNVDLDALRRQEADAREAARRAARLAAARREQEQAIRNRIDAANQLIAVQEARYQEAIARLDAASRRLPDLTLQAPALPRFAPSTFGDPGAIEQYATRLSATVDHFAQTLDSAIAAAERRLQRRIETAAISQEATELERQRQLLEQQAQEAAARARESFDLPAPPARPGADAPLEDLQAYVTALKSSVQSLAAKRADLETRLATRERAAALGGRTIAGSSASAALSRHHRDHAAAAQASLRAHINEVLASTNLQLDDLPGSVRLLIDSAITNAHEQDQHERVTYWITRESARRNGIARAIELLQSPPNLVRADAGLSQRWDSLSAQLQRIAGGREEMSPSVETEYAQLCADSNNRIRSQYAMTAWVRACAEQGLEVLEREDGQGLLLLDLNAEDPDNRDRDAPSYWVEAENLQNDEGAFCTVLTLKTDSVSTAQDEKAAETLCAKLDRIFNDTNTSIKTDTEIIERRGRVRRGSRPAAARKDHLD